MKKLITILTLIPIFLSCKGQQTYTQKLEFGLKDKVKEVTTYFCKVEQEIIPSRTENMVGKSTMTFDKNGNILERKRKWDFGALGKSEYLTKFSGVGKDITFKETARINDDSPVVISYEYEWSDDFNYAITCLEDSGYVSLITLDKNFLLIKNEYQKRNTIQAKEEIETIFENNKIKEITTKSISYLGENPKTNLLLQVVKEYDSKGNPTVIYAYSNTDKQKLEQVIYKEYTYY